MRFRPVAATVLLGLLAAPQGCAEPEAAGVVRRDHRFGIFRDLVLFRRPVADGGPFFLDRFETTNEDFRTWREGFAASRLPDTRPRARVDLHTARRFAQYRFCRVQRAAEWRYACTQGGTYSFPWGNKFVETLANTRHLGLQRSVAVGSFASGGNRIGPFDLVGNLAEWTETAVARQRILIWDADERDGRGSPRVTGQPDLELTGATLRLPYSTQKHIEYYGPVIGLPEWPSFEPPPPESGIVPYEQSGALPLGLRVWLPLYAPLPVRWLQGESGGQPAFDWTERQTLIDRSETLDMPGVDRFRGAPGLAAWLPNWAPAPSDWLIELESGELSRLIVGGSFGTEVRSAEIEPFTWTPGRRGPEVGVRVANDPEGLLVALLEYADGKPDRDAAATLLRFLREPANREVLREAWPRARLRVVAPGLLLRMLEAEFGID